ncbi:MAG: redox-active disulfide protein 2 [Bacteroidetes bacterium GWF2_33_16]|nr:MAG: redox-active disulfide protein 2 [Bacteroidetes bacterium GWE2_32_14]OFY06705.1 MAG: redox-active disulfide protein 2 [Bacteroidetes bacterium GWF2_33_16]
MEIKVLGTGCPKCKMLEKLTKEAVEKLGLNADVSKVEDIVDIMNYGVMRTPALVINGKIVLSGRIPSENEIKEILTSNNK